MSSTLELPLQLDGPAGAPPPAPHLRLVPAEPLDFDAAVRRLTPRLQRYARRRLDDAHEAEELVQEALLRAYGHRDQLATEDDLAAWCTVVTGRLVIDRLRVRVRSTCVADVPEGSRVGRDTAEVVVARDEARTALDALDAMPSRQAAVLWAREVEGLSYDEIGGRFGLTEPAVRSLLSRARKALRAEYAARGGSLPVAGLAALAPWLPGLRWAHRLRAAASRLTAPLAMGAVVLGLVGGSLHAPLLDGRAPSYAAAPAVVSRAASVPLTARTHRPAARLRTAAGMREAASVPAARVPTFLQDGPLAATCVQAGGAGAGSERCAGGDGSASLYVSQRLPDNPTHVRDVGVETDKLHCSQLPSTPATTCTESPGGHR